METYGSYQLLKRLATGGMAQIFLARQSGPEGFEKLLVLKRILPHLAENEEFVRMFLDEARIAARLNHGNIVQIFNLGAQDDSYFIAMEYIHGEDVRRVWKRSEAQRKELPVALVCRIIMEACAGIDYAHKKTDTDGRSLGIVHRDISPQNILVTFEGGVKVVDFGIAKAADQATVTRSGVLKGKYSYMSPEQAAGQKLDGRSDIFALGIVLYELLTGTRLFKRSTDLQTLSAVLACEVMPPSQVNSRSPADLDPIVMKALQKPLEERYQEALELQLALEAWLLKNQLPSSSAQLAAFMQDLYAERLAREAQAGGPVLEEGELQSSRDEGELADPKRRSISGKSLKTPFKPDIRSSGPRPAPPPAESSLMTSAERPSARQPDAVPTARVIPLDAPSITISARGGPPDLTLPSEEPPAPRRASRAWVGMAVAGLVAGGAAAGWFVTHGAAPQAIVHVVTEPPGATVVFAGRALPDTTPCTLPAVAAGAFPLVVSRAGYVEYSGTLHVPETGELTLPLIRLEKEESVAPAPRDAGVPAPASPVQLTIQTEPAGAAVYVEGSLQGPSPLTVAAVSGGQVALKLERAGYQTLKLAVTVGPGPTQTETFTLERAARGQRAPKDERRGVGRVRFAVSPWADVSCGTHKLGTTPFEDQQLPAGTYDCVFSHPQLGSKTERVEVRPNETAKVTVKLP